MKGYMTVTAAVIMSCCLTGCGGINIYINSDGKNAVEIETVQESSEETIEETSDEETEAVSEEIESGIKSVSENNIDISAERVEEWEGGEDKFAKFNIVITNNGEEEIKDWTIECDVSDSFEIVQMWGGEYELKDGKINITPVEYTKTVKAGESCEFGFNSKDKGKKPSIEKIVMNAGNISVDG